MFMDYIIDQFFDRFRTFRILRAKISVDRPLPFVGGIFEGCFTAFLFVAADLVDEVIELSRCDPDIEFVFHDLGDTIALQPAGHQVKGNKELLCNVFA